MTNNQFCNILMGCGATAAFMAGTAIFMGASCWWIVILGVFAMLFGLFEYE